MDDEFHFLRPSFFLRQFSRCPGVFHFLNDALPVASVDGTVINVDMRHEFPHFQKMIRKAVFLEPCRRRFTAAFRPRGVKNDLMPGFVKFPNHPPGLNDRLRLHKLRNTALALAEINAPGIRDRSVNIDRNGQPLALRYRV